MNTEYQLMAKKQTEQIEVIKTLDKMFVDENYAVGQYLRLSSDTPSSWLSNKIYYEPFYTLDDADYALSMPELKKKLKEDFQAVEMMKKQTGNTFRVQWTPTLLSKAALETMAQQIETMEKAMKIYPQKRRVELFWKTLPYEMLVLKNQVQKTTAQTLDAWKQLTATQQKLEDSEQLFSTVSNFALRKFARIERKEHQEIPTSWLSKVDANDLFGQYIVVQNFIRCRKNIRLVGNNMIHSAIQNMLLTFNEKRKSGQEDHDIYEIGRKFLARRIEAMKWSIEETPTISRTEKALVQVYKAMLDANTVLQKEVLFSDATFLSETMKYAVGLNCALKIEIDYCKLVLNMEN